MNIDFNVSSKIEVTICSNVRSVQEIMKVALM